MMKVAILTMHEKLYAGDAKEVILPGDDGELSAWDNHQPCLYALRPGKIVIQGIMVQGSGKEKRSIAIKRGVAHIESNRLTALVEV